MGSRRLEFLLLLFFFLLSSSNTLQYLFASALNEEQNVRNREIWENHSTKTRLVGEITVDRRGATGAGGSRGGTYSSSSAMNHGNNNDNKPSHRNSGGCTISHLGFTRLGILLLSSFLLL
ncbi:hypothetical protein VitviT2T_009111 [Vitis vinifera]|uniref:Uncharacterized protein n=2 Tax=Vitis vinifera TaxID=29760 RepID=A0ABY9C3V4_VITVI|eukprot:XP_010651870.1 PREDICTED: uncharacterized protein LOC104879730 [Vitis vinifera]